MLWKVIRDRKRGMFNIKDKEFITSIAKEIPNVKRVVKQMLEMQMLRQHEQGWYTIVGSQRYVKDVTGRKTDYYFKILDEKSEVFNICNLRTRIYAAITELIAHRKGKEYTDEEKREYFMKVQLRMGSIPSECRITYGSKSKKLKSLFYPVSKPLEAGETYKSFDHKAKTYKRANWSPKFTNTRISGRATDCSLTYLMLFSNHGTKATWSKQRKKASDLQYIHCVRDYDVIKSFKTVKERELYFNQYMSMLHDAGLIEKMNKTRRHYAYGRYAVVEDKSSIIWTEKDRTFYKKQYKSTPKKKAA